MDNLSKRKLFQNQNVYVFILKNGLSFKNRCSFGVLKTEKETSKDPYLLQSTKSDQFWYFGNF